MTVNEMKSFKKEDFDAEENIKQTLWKRKKCPGDGPTVWSIEYNLSFDFNVQHYINNFFNFLSIGI